MPDPSPEPHDSLEATRFLPEGEAGDAPPGEPSHDVTSRLSASGDTPGIPRPSDFADEQELGDFKLLRRLGKGGMAEVWLAEQTSLKRPVALKLLRSELMEDESYIIRFQREAKAAAGLQHPNIVQVYSVGCEKGQHFIAQEYVQGQTLRQVISKKGALELPLALHIIRQVASALDAAAEKGIIHRDIKPDNIMVTKKGEVKVADFGLAQLTHGEGEHLHLTQPGETMGTPLYMSPEQIRGDALDHRTDLYSLGVTCYHMLAGRPPFLGEKAVNVAVQHLQSDPTPLQEIRSDLPQPVCDLVLRLMHKDPQQRYPDASTVLGDVKNLLKALKSGDAAKVKLSRPAFVGADGTFETRHPAWALVLLCLLTASATAGIGWAMRMTDPRLTEVREDVLIPRASSAREQYLQAMLAGGTESAFLAVKEYWRGEQEWVNRAEEQLLFLYLRDPSRHDEARRQIDLLQSLGAQDARFRTEGRVAEAWLLAHGSEGDKAQARRILETTRSSFEQHLNQSWLALVEEAEAMIARERDGPGGPPFFGSPGSMGPPPGPPPGSSTGNPPGASAGTSPLPGGQPPRGNGPQQPAAEGF